MKNANCILRAFKAQQGFTLIELVVVLLSTSIILVATLPLFKVQTEAYVNVREGKKLLQEARIGFNRMIAEMKLMETSTDIHYGYSDEIKFNVPPEGLVGIKYEFANGTLYREGVRIIDGVRSFHLTFYRADGTTVSTPFLLSSQVWRIKVELVVGDADNQIALESQVSPRNFHF